MIPSMTRPTLDRTDELIAAEDKLKKLQLKIGKQKNEEKRLRTEYTTIFGTDELALEK